MAVFAPPGPPFPANTGDCPANWATAKELDINVIVRTIALIDFMLNYLINIIERVKGSKTMLSRL